MKCKNLSTGLEISFEIRGLPAGRGGIPYIMETPAGMDTPYLRHQRMVGEAVFLKAYIAKQLERKTRSAPYY
jgi:hypothetical protein